MSGVGDVMWLVVSSIIVIMVLSNNIIGFLVNFGLSNPTANIVVLGSIFLLLLFRSEVARKIAKAF